jgi:hypothetical protein
MTPGQRDLHDVQEQPENGWTIHPLIDGCDPEAKDPPPPVIK